MNKAYRCADCQQSSLNSGELFCSLTGRNCPTNGVCDVNTENTKSDLHQQFERMSDRADQNLKALTSFAILGQMMAEKGIK